MNDHIAEKDLTRFYKSSDENFIFPNDFLLLHENILKLEEYTTEWCLLKEKVVNIFYCLNAVDNCGNIYGMEQEEKNCWYNKRS